MVLKSASITLGFASTLAIFLAYQAQKSIWAHTLDLGFGNPSVAIVLTANFSVKLDIFEVIYLSLIQIDFYHFIKF